MDVLAYLSEALKIHKEVGLDGLGTFVKKRIPGRFDLASNSYLPPSYELIFTQEVRAAGVLADHISKQRHVSKNTSVYYIGEFVNEIRQRTTQTGDVTLPGIGTFTQRDAGLDFSADKSADMGHDFFGFGPVSARNEVEVAAAVPDANEPIEEESSDEAAVAAAPQDDQGVAVAAAVPDANEPIEEEQSSYGVAVAPQNAERTPQADQTRSAPVIETITPDEIEAEAANEYPANDNETPAPHNADRITQDEQEAAVAVAAAPQDVERITQAEQEAAVALASQDAERITHNEYDEQDPPSRKPVYIKWLIIIFILVVVGAVALMARPDLYDKWFANKADSTVTTFDKNKLKSTQDTLSADTALANRVRAVVRDSLMPAPVVVAQDTITFEILATAAESEQKIQTYISRYNKMGFNAKAIPTSKRKTSISVASFSSREAAMDSLPGVWKKLKSRDPYVKEIRNNGIKK